MGQDWPPERVAKFRQAGFVYLHVAILYEAAVYAMLGAGALPARFGPPVVWLIGGGAVAAFGFVGLYHWRNVWFARILWALNAARTPSLIGGAFFAAPEGDTLNVLSHGAGRRGHQPLDARTRRMGLVIGVEH